MRDSLSLLFVQLGEPLILDGFIIRHSLQTLSNDQHGIAITEEYFSSAAC
ncbi:MAG: hypothetical protein R3E58_16305 [Phycisphaerae bacterium]